MNHKAWSLIAVVTSVMLAGVFLTATAQSPIKQKVQQKPQQVVEAPAFTYDTTALPDAKPWTAKARATWITSCG